MAANPSIQLGTDGNWAIKEDNLLAYKEDGTRFFNKEFDFTRNTTATFVDQNGLIQESDTNTPRIDFTDDATGHLLLEPQRTNLLLQSNSFNGWTKNDITLTSSQSGVYGSNNAWLIQQNTNSSRHNIYKSVSSSGTHTFSIYAKAKELQYIQIASVQTADEYANFDLSDGSVGNVGSRFLDAKATSVGNGWYRLSVYTNNGSNFLYISLIQSKTDGWLQSFSGSNSTDGLYIQHAQVESNSYPTSIIETTSSQVTRNADICNNSGSAQDFNSEEGVIYGEIAALESTSLGSKFISISDETYNNRASILFSNGSTNQIRCFLRVGGVSQVDKSTNITDVTDFNKVAFSFKENEFKVFINGSQSGSTDTSGSVWTSGTITKLSLTEINSALGAFNGKVRNLKVFKRAMSDGELYLLTVPQYQSYQEMATALNYTL
jgi:hypothetical protein